MNIKRLLFGYVLALFFSQIAIAQIQIPFDVAEPAKIDAATGSLTGATNFIVSSNTGSSQLNGISIAQIVGADRFYQEGYTGSQAIFVNIEGGHAWNEHQTLQDVNVFLDARPTYEFLNVPFGQLGEFDRHATWVAHDMGGFNSGMQEHRLGIAFGAEMWSGAIATEYVGDPFTAAWGFSHGYAFTDAYTLPLLIGIDGRTADVSNSSWGFFDGTASTDGGSSIFTLTADGIAKQSGATVVFSAGNAGPDPNTVRAPANGYNSIVVGATGDDLNSPPYSTITGFSSRGPQRYFGPDGDFGLVRARVDLVAPGENLTLAFYGGTTGGNINGDDVGGGGQGLYSPNAYGTSFAAPTVAAAAALVGDVIYDRFPENAERGRNGQVVKAILLNSASKPDSWDNGQSASIPYTTDQALDYVYGAGMLNLDTGFDQVVAGNTDLPGDLPGFIGATGWDFGIVHENGTADYPFNQDLVGGTTFTATLNWFVGREWISTFTSGAIISEDNYFTDLSLELYRLENGTVGNLVSVSDAKFINTEHFCITIPETGRYLLRVNWQGERYDLVGNDQQTFGLAWRGTGNILLGDVNRDGQVDLLDVQPFVQILSSFQYTAEADVNEDGEVDLLDVSPFVNLL